MQRRVPKSESKVHSADMVFKGVAALLRPASGGKFAFEHAILADQGLIETVTDAGEFQCAFGRNTGASFECKRKAQIDQQQQVLVGARRLMEVIQNIEDPIAARHVVVEGGDEA